MIDERNLHKKQIEELRLDSGGENLNLCGFDPTAPSPIEEEVEAVEVNDNDYCFSHMQVNQLQLLDVLADSNSNGIDIFIQAMEIVSTYE